MNVRQAAEVLARMETSNLMEKCLRHCPEERQGRLQIFIDHLAQVRRKGLVPKGKAKGEKVKGPGELMTACVHS